MRRESQPSEKVDKRCTFAPPALYAIAARFKLAPDAICFSPAGALTSCIAAVGTSAEPSTAGAPLAAMNVRRIAPTAIPAQPAGVYATMAPPASSKQIAGAAQQSAAPATTPLQGSTQALHSPIVQPASCRSSDVSSVQPKRSAEPAAERAAKQARRIIPEHLSANATAASISPQEYLPATATAPQPAGLSMAALAAAAGMRAAQSYTHN